MGPLVDYSDSASNESVDEEPPIKRRRNNSGSSFGSAGGDDDNEKRTASNDGSTEQEKEQLRQQAGGGGGGGSSGSDMPPLPSAFHDLYASNVRQSVSDDSSLHQGRKRVIPHVPGNWPTHVYVEWYPTSYQHDVLIKLLKDVEKELNGEINLHDFLTSDLGAPLPLHISLSRPISLPTADKDKFYDHLRSSLHASGLTPFSVTPRGLAWYKSPDSDRTFLIIRVTAHDSSINDITAPNPELLALLRRCNTVAASFGQPPLYQQTKNEPVGTAFHVSIGWSFGLPQEVTSLRTLKVLKQRQYSDVREWEIDVSAVKVKIGNIVHHVALSGTSRDVTVDGKVFER